MNTISLHSLYIGKIVVDFVLAFYTLFIYRRFHHEFAEIEYLVLCRFAVFIGFALTFFSYLSPMIILEVVGSILLTFASALILLFLSKQTKQPYRSHLHIGLLVIYIIGYGLLLLTDQGLQSRVILNSAVLILQHLLFFTDYFKLKIREYNIVVSLLVLFLVIHMGRLLHGLQHIDAIINPLTGDIFSAVAVTIFIAIDVVITLNINTHIHLNKLFTDINL